MVLMACRGAGQPKPAGRGRVWTQLVDGRPVMLIGKHAGKDIDAVPERDLRWILDAAELRPGHEEELELREAAGEVGGGVARAATEEWTNVVVGTRSFAVPPGVAQLFGEELDRLKQLTGCDWQALEGMVANSAATPIESMD